MVISQSGGKRRVKRFWLVQFCAQDLLILHFQRTFKPLRKCVPSSYLNQVNYKAKHENKLEVAFRESMCFHVLTTVMKSMFIYYYGFDVCSR